MLPGIGHAALLGGAAAIADAAVAYQGTATLAPAGTNSFVGMSFGAAASGRYIVVGVTTGGTGASGPSSITIGGVSATLVAAKTGSQSTSVLGIAAVPTGASGTVMVTGPGGDRMAITVWRVTGLLSATPTDTATTSNSHSLSTSTLDVSAGGIAIGILAAAADTAGGDEIGWTGLTEDVEDLMESGTAGPYSGASRASAAALTNITVTASVVTENRNCYSLASWR